MMSSRQKTVLIIIGLVILALGVVIHLTLRSTAMGEYAKEKIIAVAGTQGIPLRIDRTSCGWTGCEAQGVSVVIPHAFSYLRLDEVSVAPRIASIAHWVPEMGIDGRTYGGRFKGTFSRSVSTLRGSFSASGLQASEIPQLSGIGITGGSVDIDVRDIEIGPGGIHCAPGRVTVVKASKPQKTTLPPLLTGLPVPIDIPSVGELNLAVTFLLEGGKLQVSEGELSGSFGKVSLKGEVAGRLSAPLLITGRADLTQEGVRNVTMFGGPASPRFEFRVAGTAAAPDFSTKPLP